MPFIKCAAALFAVCSLLAYLFLPPARTKT